jgi:hypothetical protein
VKNGAKLGYLGPNGKIILNLLLQIGWEVSVQDRDLMWYRENVRDPQNGAHCLNGRYFEMDSTWSNEQPSDWH